MQLSKERRLPDFIPRYFLRYNNNDEENNLVGANLSHPSTHCQKSGR